MEIMGKSKKRREEHSRSKSPLQISKRIRTKSAHDKGDHTYPAREFLASLVLSNFEKRKDRKILIFGKIVNRVVVLVLKGGI